MGESFATPSLTPHRSHYMLPIDRRPMGFVQRQPRAVARVRPLRSTRRRSATVVTITSDVFPTLAKTGGNPLLVRKFTNGARHGRAFVSGRDPGAVTPQSGASPMERYSPGGQGSRAAP